MKLVKRLMCLLLVLCMFVGFAPAAVFAEGEGTPEETPALPQQREFYRIVHLDAGRKYFSEEAIIRLLDIMADAGMNQLDLYLADNQGLRFALEDMTVKTTVNGGHTYNLKDSLGNGYNDGTFRTYAEGTRSYLSQTEMDNIIAHAKTKKIEIVPCINVPGHMGAILNPDRNDVSEAEESLPENPMADLRLVQGGKPVLSSIDLDNPEAVDFALKLTEKYATYFASRGCKYYSIGADEYAYGSPADQTGFLPQYYDFLNRAAAIIKEQGMVPRAFCDVFESDTAGKIDHDYEVYCWKSLTQEKLDLISKNHKVINSSLGIYWVPGNDGWADPLNALKTFNVKNFSGGSTMAHPAGAMFCIWNDVGTNYDHCMDEVNDAQKYIDEFGKHVTDEAVGVQTIKLDIGKSSEQKFEVEGKFTKEQLANKFGFNGIAEATVTGGKDASDPVGPDAPTKAETIKAGDKVLIGDGTNYVGCDGDQIIVTDLAGAEIWTVAGSGTYNFLNAGGKYLRVDGSSVFCGGDNGLSWKFDGQELSHGSWGGQNYCLNLENGKWVPSEKTTSVLPYLSAGEGTPGTPGTTIFTVTGKANGTMYFTAPDGTPYKVIVGTGIPDHKCNQEIPANCMSPARCSICGKVTGDKKDPQNHVGPVSKATCKTPGICSACGEPDVNTPIDPTNHEGPFEVRGEKPATDTLEGYTGDRYCMACGKPGIGTLVEKGTVIPVIQPHDKDSEITLEVGGTYEFTVVDMDLTLDAKPDDPTASVTVKYIPEIPGKPEEKPKPAGDPTLKKEELKNGDKIYLKQGEYYLAFDGTNFSTTKDIKKAALLIFEKSELKLASNPNIHIDSSYNGDLITGTNRGLRWSYDQENKRFYSQEVELGGDYQQEKHKLYLHFSDGTPKLNGKANKTTDDEKTILYNPGTPATEGKPAVDRVPAKSVVTITGKKVGVTYPVINNKTYQVTVVKSVPKINLYAWVTNQPIDDEGDAGNMHTISSGAHPELKTDDGMLIAGGLSGEKTGLLWARGKVSFGGGHPVIYYITTKLHKNASTIEGVGTEHQTNPGADKFPLGTSCKYLRYREAENVWQVSEDRSKWIPVEKGDQLDVYYLQETEVTQEVTTDVVDWGVPITGDNYQNFIVLDFAVYTEGSGRTPSLDTLPVKTKSIIFHCNYLKDNPYNKVALVGTEGESKDKVIPTGTDYNANEHVALRRLDTIYGAETGDYEVYMITLTSTAKNYDSSMANDSNGLEHVNYSYKNTYKNHEEKDIEPGEERIIWTETKADFEKYKGKTTKDGKTLGYYPSKEEYMEKNPDFTWPDFQYADQSFFPIVRTTGEEDTNGLPIVDYIHVPNKQGMLVTYYVRPKTDVETKLSVHYRLEGSNEDFYNYDIAVNEGTYFDSKFNSNGKEPSATETGLAYNTVKNSAGNINTVSAYLGGLLNLDPAFKTGSYVFTEHIKFKLDDGTEVEDYSSGNIKEVILYYALDNAQIVPVDFGNPMLIGNNLDGSANSDKHRAINVALPEGTETDDVNKLLRFGRLEKDAENQLWYIPEKVMTGAETPIDFVVTFEIPDESAGNGKKTSVDEPNTVIFMPATTVYYEESFATPVGEWHGQMQLPTTEYAQECKHYAVPEFFNYGYDPGMEWSGKSCGTEATIKDTSGALEFTFNGTGFEVYANCTPKTDIALVAVFDNDSKTMVNVYVVDTHMGSGSQSGTQEQNVAASNVPIVSRNDLEYGNYTVRIGYCGKSENGGDGVNFDGFRVYNPLKNNPTIATDLKANDIYEKQNEANPIFQELRDAVLAEVGIPENYNDNGVYAPKDNENVNVGSVIVDQVHNILTKGVQGIIVESLPANPDIIKPGEEITVSTDRIDNGPKNELYLRHGQSVIFKVNPNENGQIGLKSLQDNVPVQYQIGGQDPKTLQSSTDMYYPFTADENGIVTITNLNEKSGILSLTKIKYFSEIPIPKRVLTAKQINNALVNLGIIAAPKKADELFADVQNDDWYAGNVVFVQEHDLMKGVGFENEDGTGRGIFDPMGETSRAMIATILWRMNGSKAPKEPSGFADVKADDWYADAIAWMKETGLGKGKEGNMFEPEAAVTREELVTFFYRYAEYAHIQLGEPAELTEFKDHDMVQDWAADAMKAMVGTGIIGGRDDGTLDPAGTATRAEVAAVLQRFIENTSKPA